MSDSRKSSTIFYSEKENNSFVRLKSETLVWAAKEKKRPVFLYFAIKERNPSTNYKEERGQFLVFNLSRGYKRPFRIKWLWE